MKISDALNSGTVVTVGSLELKIKSPTLRVLGKFEKWLQSKIYESARNLAASLPESGRPPVLAEAVRCASQVSLASPEGQSLIQTMEGFSTFIAMCSTKTDGSPVTADEILDACTVSNLGELRAQLKGVLGENELTHPPEAAKTGSQS